MNIRGTVTERKQVQVDIDPIEVIQAIEQQWKDTMKITGEYINSEKRWEKWYSTHGSGTYEDHGPASDSDIEIMDAFKAIKHIAHLQRPEFI